MPKRRKGAKVNIWAPRTSGNNRVRKSGAAQATAAEDHFHDAEAIGRAPFENVKFPLPNPAPQWRGARGLSGERFSGTLQPEARTVAQAFGAWLRSVRDASPVP
jgi:hypothetical protein